MSVDPSTLATPVRNFTGNSTAFIFNERHFQDNYLFDLGFNVTYKTDWLLAYVNFVKNLGSVDMKDNIQPPTEVVGNRSADYTGFMVDAGVTYFCGPWTANIGGF